MGPGSPTSAVSWKGIVQLRQCKMSRLLPTSFLVLVAATLLLLVISTSAEPKPGRVRSPAQWSSSRAPAAPGAGARWAAGRCPGGEVQPQLGMRGTEWYGP